MREAILDDPLRAMIVFLILWLISVIFLFQWSLDIVKSLMPPAAPPPPPTTACGAMLNPGPPANPFAEVAQKVSLAFSITKKLSGVTFLIGVLAFCIMIHG